MEPRIRSIHDNRPRGLNDRGQDDPERQRLNGGGGNNGYGNFNIESIDNNPRKQPKDENYWNMLQYNLCPRFRVLSCTFFLFIINIIAYCVCLGLSIKDLTSDNFLGMNASDLSSYGAKNSYKIRYDYHLHRWIVPVFLHANFMHIFFNSVSIFWIGFMVEHNLGKVGFLILYLGSGIGAFIFSALITDSISVGASGAIFGLLGILISNLIINWRHIFNSNNFISTILIIAMLSLIALSGGGNTDNYGHFGGLIYGVFIGLVILKFNPNERRWRSKLSFAGWVTLIFVLALYALMISLFFTVRHPKSKV